MKYLSSTTPVHRLPLFCTFSQILVLHSFLFLLFQTGASICLIKLLYLTCPTLVLDLRNSCTRLTQL